MNEEEYEFSTDEEWNKEAWDFWDHFTNIYYYIPDTTCFPSTLTKRQLKLTKNELTMMKIMLEKTISFIENKLANQEK